MTDRATMLTTLMPAHAELLRFYEIVRNIWDTSRCENGQRVAYVRTDVRSSDVRTIIEPGAGGRLFVARFALREHRNRDA